MKLLAIVGSRKQGNTDILVKKYLEVMKAGHPDVEYKMIYLHEHAIKPCISCKNCLLKSEALCPLKDDMKLLLDEIYACDGLIAASPNFVSNVSGIMKNFIDRLAYLGHRPIFFDKWVMALATSAGPGGAKSCLNVLTHLWEYSGFNVRRGMVVSTPPYRSAADVMDGKRNLLEKETDAFYELIKKKTRKQPSMHMLTTYNFFKAMCNSKPDFMKRHYLSDYQYYMDNSWLDKKRHYFDDRKLGLGQKLLSKAVYGIFCVVSKRAFD